MSWSGKYKNGESFHDLTDEEIDLFGDEVDVSSAVENTPSTTRADSAAALRQQAASNFLADQRAAQDETWLSVQQDQPIATALWPRAAEAAARDRGFGYQFAGALKDVTSFPGRALVAGMGGGGLAAMRRTAADPDLPWYAAVPQDIVTDPYLLPAMYLGGGAVRGLSQVPYVGKLASGLAGRYLLPAGANVGIGMLDRFTDPDRSATEGAPLAFEAGAGLLGAGLGHGITAATEKWVMPGVRRALGSPIFEKTNFNHQDKLAARWVPEGFQGDRKDAAKEAIGAYVAVDPEGRPIPQSFLSAVGGEGGNYARLRENIALKKQMASDRLGQATSAMDNEYRLATELMGSIDEVSETNPRQFYSLVTGEEAPRGDRALEEALNSPEFIALYAAKNRLALDIAHGVPIDDIMEQSLRDLSRMPKAYDIPALEKARQDILSSRIRGNPATDLPEGLAFDKSTEGYIAPAVARDLRNRLYGELKQGPNAKYDDLTDYYDEVYGRINESLSGSLENLRDPRASYSRTAPLAAQDAEALGIKNYMPSEEQYIADYANQTERHPVLGSADLPALNRDMSRALSLEPGLARSSYEPRDLHSKFSKNQDLLGLDIKVSKPWLAVAQALKSPTGRYAAVQAAPGVARGLVGASGRSEGRKTSKETQDDRRRQEDLARLRSTRGRGLTEATYRNIEHILNKPERKRTATDLDYLAANPY